uniref:Reverse transcriptase Ty1/copia-type domain-containing protein n=1 Tax=Chromera velia CCMP2878 TaxID=1169474 RepID=A0A0G4I277_9ALVE|eukprot:Cvel_34985.t1-p1 / transcript=Cvel_34985.t1 / gene=Cvel_34985 / organism=Chromera_velia_CCMP2878 / gene_product=hypothetical protein / transcript_product=hypothetical protein / location=Cvel_scaffold6209:29-1474(+) / protein_length=482 / sequence_SO=supercontig / SO=protein_coding / is_pseudo=false
MVIKGGADPRVYDTYAGVLAQQSLLTCLPYMITIGKVIYSVDVVKAFQQIEDRHKHSLGVLGVRIPAGLPELPVENPFPEKYDDDQWLGLRRKAAVLIPGAIHRLEKAHYGGRHAGNLFVFSLQFELQKDGEYTLVEEAVLVRREGAGRDGIKNGVPCKRGAASEVLVHYIDDIQGAGAKMLTTLTQLGKNIKLGPIGELGEGGSDRFAGIDMEREGGKLYLSKKTYLKDIEAEKILQRAGGRRVTVDESMMEPPKEGEVDTSLTEEYRAAYGILGWAASFFWKRRVFYDELQRFTRNPTRRHLRNAGLVISRMQQEKERIEIRPLLPEGRAVHFYSDASRKPKTKEVRKGTIGFWGDETWSHEKGDEWNPVLFKTARSTKLHDHLYSAEMEALKQTVREAWRPCYLIDELTGKFPRVRFYLDSKGVYDSLRSGKSTAEPELQKELDYVIQGMRRMGVDMLRDVVWTPRELNRADWLTKPIW